MGVGNDYGRYAKVMAAFFGLFRPNYLKPLSTGAKGIKMAQYTYPYLCGHGHGTVRLYGKESERQRKLAWYADTFVCPECFKKQKAEEDAAAPKTASLHLAVYGDVYQSITV